MPVTREPFMHCLTCGYDLRGLDNNRCPECGRAFDPNDAKTFTSADPPRRPLLSGSVGIAILVIWVGAGFSAQLDLTLLAIWILAGGMFSAAVGCRPQDLVIGFLIIATLLFVCLGPDAVCRRDRIEMFLIVPAATAALLAIGFLLGRVTIRRPN